MTKVEILFVTECTNVMESMTVNFGVKINQQNLGSNYFAYLLKAQLRRLKKISSKFSLKCRVYTGPVKQMSYAHEHFVPTQRHDF